MTDLKPIDMVLFCPVCGLQHIDKPDTLHVWDGKDTQGNSRVSEEGVGAWTNPPHRSHLCARCCYIWRPADVPTNGVVAVKTKGQADSTVISVDTVSTVAKPNVKISSQGVAVDQEYFWNEDMSTCQRGNKYQLLGQNGLPQYRVYDGDAWWIAHAPLPKRRLKV